MAAADDTLEILLEKATNSGKIETDWNAINEFAKKIGDKPEEIQSALWLLVRHIHSSIEIEAVNALKTLEFCVERCGKSFRDEVGKFRFLNELIKLVSPKYLGNRTSIVVKKKVIELLYAWSNGIKDQPKFEQAYGMLKRQGVVTQDPVIEPPGTPPPPRSKNEIFDDEEKAKALKKLLHSANRDDYQAANRLIKTMVKEHERKIEQVVKRETDLATVSTNVGVLKEMLNNYRAGSTTGEEIEVMKELYQTCETMRPNLFRLASETDDKDNSLGHILKSNDELTEVMELYKKMFGASNSETVVCTKNEQQSTGLSLLDLGTPEAENKNPTTTTSALDDQLLSLGLDDESFHNLAETVQPKSDLDVLSDIFSSLPPPSINSVTLSAAGVPMLTPMRMNPLPDLDSLLSTTLPTTTTENKKFTNKGLEDLDALGLNLLKQSLPPNSSLGAEFNKPVEKLTMNQMKKQFYVAPSPPLQPQTAEEQRKIGSSSLEASLPITTRDVDSVESNSVLGPSSSSSSSSALSDLVVPLESITPGSVPSLTLYNKNDINVVIHFGKDKPKPNIYVMVVTTINKSTSSVSDFGFDAEVPKNMKVKLQPPSDTRLPAFNPILPPSAITQIMLIERPSSEETLRLNYRITYTQNDRDIVNIGEVENLKLT